MNSTLNALDPHIDVGWQKLTYFTYVNVLLLKTVSELINLIIQVPYTFLINFFSYVCQVSDFVQITARVRNTQPKCWYQILSRNCSQMPIFSMSQIWSWGLFLKITSHTGLFQNFNTTKLYEAIENLTDHIDNGCLSGIEPGTDL